MQKLAKKKKSKRGLCKNERREKGLPRLLHNDRAIVCSSRHFGVDVLCDNDINAMIINTKRVVKCSKVSLLGLNLMLGQY